MILYFFKFVLMAKHTMISSVTRVIVQTHDSLVSLTDSLVLSSVYILRSSESNHLATSEKLLLFNELSFSRQRDGTGNWRISHGPVTHDFWNIDIDICDTNTEGSYDELIASETHVC